MGRVWMMGRCRSGGSVSRMRVLRKAMSFRARAAALAALCGVLPISTITAQRVISADSLRPPLVLDPSPDVRLMTAVRLQILQLERAIQRADTLQLMAVLGEAVAPDTEVAVARQRGCPSLGWALRETRRTRGRPGRDAPVPLNRVVLTVRRLTTEADGSVSADLRLQDVGSARRDFGDLRLEFARRESAAVPRLAVALRAVLCGMALTQ